MTGYSPPEPDPNPGHEAGPPERLDAMLRPHRDWNDKVRAFWAANRRTILIWAGSMVAVLVLAAVLVGRHYAQKAATVDLDRLTQYNETSFFYDRHGQKMTKLFSEAEDRVVLKPNEIPAMMRSAAIAVEDKRFFAHSGVDPIGILQAMLQNVRAGDVVAGGSTITQQLAKYVAEDFSKTLDRKLTEAFLAMRIEERFSKDEILNHYLNRIYYGSGYFGLGAAARGYFGKAAQELTLSECALLAGIIRSPNSASPRRDLAMAQRRRDVVLHLMLEQGKVPREAVEKARKEPVRIKPRESFGVRSYAIEKVVKDLYDTLDLKEDEVPLGYHVYTTLDQSLQERIDKVYSDVMVKLEARRRVQGMDRGGIPLQGAAVFADSGSGAVRALIGGREFKKSMFNRATMAEREVGGVLAPIVYAAAFERVGLNPATMINSTYIADEELNKLSEIKLGDARADVRNRYLTIHDAMALAMRPCEIRAAVAVGLKALESYILKLGVVSDFKPLDVASGEERMAPWDVAGFYQTLANAGLGHSLHVIEKVVGSDGAVLFQHQPRQEGGMAKTIAQQIALTMSMGMREGNARDLTISQFQFENPVAAVASFSSNYRDAWVAGFTPRTVGVTWLGYDDNEPMGVSFTRSAAPLMFGSLMEAAIKGEPKAEFEIPPSMVKVEVDRYTGVVRGPAGLSPKPNHVFTFVRESVVRTIMNSTANAPGPAANVTSDDDLDWIASMFAVARLDGEATSRSSSLLAIGTSDIPPFAEFRLPGVRGDIRTADGVKLATTVQSPALVLSWPPFHIAGTEDEAIAWASERLTEASRVVRATFDFPDTKLFELYRFQRYLPIVAKDDLTPDELARYRKSDLSKKGFDIQMFPRREYPQGALASHLVGFVSKQKRRAEGKVFADSVLYDEFQGFTGIELAYDKELRGEEGIFGVRTDPAGFLAAGTKTKPEKMGFHLQTSLIGPLQLALEDAMTNVNRGAVVVVDVNTGGVAGMVSRPSFVPAHCVPNMTTQIWGYLNQKPELRLLNRGFMEFHPPGSAFKVVTAMAAAMGGALDPNRVYHASGSYSLPGVSWSFPKEKSSVNFESAMAQSYNSYFMDLGNRAGRDTMIRVAAELGFGQVTGFDLPYELAGLFPTPDYVRKQHQRLMGAGDIANASIGQGDVLVTPLQLANAMAAVANGGKVFKPRVVWSLLDSSDRVVSQYEPTLVRQLEVDPNMLAEIRDAMVAVTTYGTGRAAQVPGTKVAGKTGTAQIDAKRRDVAWFAGFLPAEQPQFAFCAMVEGELGQDYYGGRYAAPVIGQAFTKYFETQQQQQRAVQSAQVTGP